MAIALVGTIGTKVQTAASSALTTWAWGASENRTAGNLLTAFVSVTGSATLPTTPTGWTIGKQVAGTSCSATIYWKKAVGTDAVPTIAAITSGLIAGQLAEWSGALAAVDQSGSKTGTTSPTTATAAGANQATAELILMAAADRRSAGRASNDTWTSNDGTVTAAGNNNGATSTDHYSFGYIASSTATTAQTSVVTLSVTTSITGIANVNVSFPQPSPKAVAPTALSTTWSGGTPTVLIGTNVTPAALATTFAGATPTVAATVNQLVTPTALALTFTGATPTVATPIQASPAGLAMTFTGATPSVATPIAVNPAALALAFTGAVPAVLTPLALTPTALALAFTGAVPSVLTPVAAAPDVLAMTWGGATPTVAISTGSSIVVSPAALAMALAFATPTVAVSGAAVVSSISGRNTTWQRFRPTPFWHERLIEPVAPTEDPRNTQALAEDDEAELIGLW